MILSACNFGEPVLIIDKKNIRILVFTALVPRAGKDYSYSNPIYVIDLSGIKSHLHYWNQLDVEYETV